MTASTQTQPFAFLLNGELRAGPAVLDVRSPYSGDLIGRASLAGRGDVDRGDRRRGGRRAGAAALPSHARAAVLDRIAAGVAERQGRARPPPRRRGGQAARAGPHRDRPRRLRVPAGGGGGHAHRRRGDSDGPRRRTASSAGASPAASRSSPISAIIPFNFPVLLAAHKLAPAIACGATMVLKPPPQDPLATLLLARSSRRAAIPPARSRSCSAPTTTPRRCIDDPRVRMITFTGSARVGWAIRQRARRSGSPSSWAATPRSWSSPMPTSTTRCSAASPAATSMPGSPASPPSASWCTSRLPGFVELFVAAVSALFAPAIRWPRRTDVGPMIDEASAERRRAWIAEAVARGARLAVGGTPDRRHPASPPCCSTRPATCG